MSPFYYYDDTTAVADIQWISPTESYASQYPTCTYAGTSQSYYRQEYVYEPKKEETRKERLARQSSAFKMFYRIPQYAARKRNKFAERKEVMERVNKFKGLNRNLIL